MPLVGIADGDRKVSSLLTDDEWADLQKDVRAKRVSLVLRCGQPGHPKTRSGTRFFAHNPGSGHQCESTGETPQHLRAKDIIVKAAVAAGWDAEPEVRGDGWVADVLATRGQHKVAFEVQWSNQSDADYAHRQSRYKRDGVRGAWFVRHTSNIPTTPSADIPLFLLAEDGDDLVAAVTDKVEPLADAITLLLAGRVRHREYVSAGEPADLDIRIHRNDCWKCEKEFLIWHAQALSVTGNCGRHRDVGLSYEVFAKDRVENDTSVRAAVARAIANQGIPLGRLNLRFTQTAGTKYMAFVCPHCNAVSGDMFINQLILNDGYEEPYLMVRIPGGDRGLRQPHWCVAGEAGHCAEPPSGYKSRHLGEPEDQGSQREASVSVQMVGDGGIGIRDAVRTMMGGSYF